MLKIFGFFISLDLVLSNSSEGAVFCEPRQERKREWKKKIMCQVPQQKIRLHLETGFRRVVNA